LGLLVLFEQILAEIHNSTHGRLNIWRYFNEVQALFFRQLDAFPKRHNSCLLTLRVNHSNLSGVDFLIAPYALCNCDTQILQKLNNPNTFKATTKRRSQCGNAILYSRQAGYNLGNHK
jgi:hypothetical protein